LSLFHFLFNKVLVHTALNNEDYFNVAHSFKNEGLHYKIKNNSQNSFSLGQPLNENDYRNQFIYDFYVKKEDQYKAQKILSTIRR